MISKKWIMALALALFLAAAGVALASDGIERARWVASGGASDSTNGDVALRATLGQPVLGIVTNAGGDVVLGQGFWHGGVLPPSGYHVHLPLIQKQHTGR
jgi:hypothetical protein